MEYAKALQLHFQVNMNMQNESLLNKPWGLKLDINHIRPLDLDLKIPTTESSTAVKEEAPECPIWVGDYFELWQTLK